MSVPLAILYGATGNVRMELCWGTRAKGSGFQPGVIFSNVRNIQQMSQAFLVSMGVGARDAAKHPEMHGPAPCPQQRIMWSKMSITPRLRNSTLVEEWNS